MFPLGDVTAERFLSEYWRKKPLFVKGAVDRVLDQRVTESEFRALTDELEKSRPDLVRRGEHGLVAAQNIGLASPRLAAWVRDIARQLSWPTAWMDGVLAEHGGSIGGHFDDSDNFILQQEGTKVWRLHDPSIVSEEAIRRVMLRKGATDTSVDMPEGALEFRVEPGDLLYVPIFWAHYGTSDGPSLSVSLVCNSENALGLLPLLYWVLSERREWWEPLPMPRLFDPATGSALEPDTGIEVLFDRLLSVFGDEGFRKRVEQEWWALRSERTQAAYSDEREPAGV